MPGAASPQTLRGYDPYARAPSPPATWTFLYVAPYRPALAGSAPGAPELLPAHDEANSFASVQESPSTPPGGATGRSRCANESDIRGTGALPATPLARTAGCAIAFPAIRPESPPRSSAGGGALRAPWPYSERIPCRGCVPFAFCSAILRDAAARMPRIPPDPLHEVQTGSPRRTTTETNRIT